ncbi:MAG: acyl-CoA thioesterase [Acidimicrobiales bacterium]
MSDPPPVLRVEPVGPNRWRGPNPEKDPEGRDIVFSGQILAQMIMASNAALESEKEVKSIHAIFARAGRYSEGPVELIVDPMHAGRAWASSSVTAEQGDRLLSRGLVLFSAVEPDLVRSSPRMPDVPAPEDCPAAEYGVVFPDTEVRTIDAPSVGPEGGSATIRFWARGTSSYDSAAANQAIVAWGQPGFIIGAALRPHSDVVDVREAHRTISTGVISHTAHFHEPADVGDWLLYTNEAAYAGHGRVFGTGSVFTRAGELVSTFAQDSMARRVEGTLDFKTGM